MMKRIKQIISVGIILISGIVQAQLSPTENYIYVKTYLDYNASTNQPTKISETVQYFDGLGRPKQIVNIKTSPLEKDVVTPILYDAFGKQTREYLPVPQQSTNNGAIYPQTLGLSDFPIGDPTGTYTNEKAFSEKQLENSPLDRILTQKQVGVAWGSKPVQFGYDTNATGDAVKKYTIVTTWEDKAIKNSVSQSINYGNAQLYKNIVTDEDGNATIEFKNGEGQVLLVRKVISATENADTYYVYNEYNQLAFVIPPKAAVASDPNSVLNDLCYQYRYDSWNRLVEKKLPGKGWEYMVYDKADRLVMTQDAVMKPLGKWLFTKYDKFSRVVYTGIANIGAQFVRIQVQDSVDYYINQGQPSTEDRNTTGFTNSGMSVYYGNSVYPTTIDKVLSVNYYDTYPIYSFNPTFPSNVFAQTVLTDNATANAISTKSLPVMSLVKNIEDDNWTKNYTYYDTKGRAISIHSINHLGGFTRTSSDLDFSGTVKQTLIRHTRLATDTERSVRDVFTYDTQNRLLTHTHQVGTGTIEYLAQNKYNELSQLESKKVGGSIAAPLQQIDYKYNIRGWMTQINDPATLGSDLFGYSIKYDNPLTQNWTPRYNGNISEVDWVTKNDNVVRRYVYMYDSVNRLTGGYYLEPNNSVVWAGYFNENYNYDLNGNITKLTRMGKSPNSQNTSVLIDDLTYTYAGNRLSTVADASQNSTGYPYLATPNTIGYDANGNMTIHKDKDLELIDYNFLNLPSKITGKPVKAQKITTNLYRADGVKVSKIFSAPAIQETNKIEYLDGFQYKFNTGPVTPPTPNGLQFVPTSEGYYDFTSNSYIYNYTDHLGNVRVGYKKGASGAEIIEENNYYPFGLKHEGYNNLVGNPYYYQYKYNGKELQETGMYDYGARMYMPDIGRWGVVDPLAEKMTRYTPYNYAFDNPIRFIDRDGRKPDDFIFNEKGDYVGYKKTKVDQIVIQHSKSKKEIGRYNMNDPKADAKDIRAGLISKVKFISGSQIKNEMVRNGTKTTTESKWKYIERESRPAGDQSIMSGKSSGKLDAVSTSPLVESGTLHLVNGNGASNSGTAFNNFDFGNFLWGQSGKTLGFDLSTLKGAAHLNNAANGQTDNPGLNTGLLDSPGDQAAIEAGFYYPSGPPRVEGNPGAFESISPKF